MNTLSVFEIRRLRELAKEPLLPFMSDAALLKRAADALEFVLRCDGCKFWGPFADFDHKECRKVHDPDTGVGESPEELMTKADFGCVQWEEK